MKKLRILLLLAVSAWASAQTTQFKSSNVLITGGTITGTTVSKITLTAPATSATLTIANGKTLTASNTLTLAGTDSTVMTFPSTSATIARTDAAQTIAGTQTFSGAIVSTFAPASGTLRTSTDDSYIKLLGGTSGANSAAIFLTGVSTAGTPNTVLVDATTTTFRGVNGGSTFATVNSTGVAVTGLTSTTTLTVTASSSPASGAACTAGTITWDASYIYVCTASAAWKRAALTGGY